MFSWFLSVDKNNLFKAFYTYENFGGPFRVPESSRMFFQWKHTQLIFGNNFLYIKKMTLDYGDIIIRYGMDYGNYVEISSFAVYVLCHLIMHLSCKNPPAHTIHNSSLYN